MPGKYELFKFNEFGEISKFGVWRLDLQMSRNRKIAKPDKQNQTCVILPICHSESFSSFLIYHYDISCKGLQKEVVYLDAKVNLLN